MTYQTDHLIETLYAQTEHFLETAVREWQMLPPERLAARPAPGAWSAAQCLEHLNVYGRYYLPAIEKAMAAGKRRGHRPAPVFRSGLLGGYFTKLMQPQADGKLKSKMQAPKNAIPQETPDPIAMLAEFINQQEAMLRLLEAAKSANLKQAKVPISIAPWLRLRLGDTFLFYTAHHQRHVLQIQRALAGAGAKTATAAPRW